MFFSYYYISLLLFLGIVVGKLFRNDYEYNADVEGWMKLHVIPTTFDDARRLCYLEGAVLASPVSDKMLIALDFIIKKSGDCAIHTGVHSMYSKGYFYSIEGVPLTKMPVQWAQGEPDNAGNNESCIAYITNGTVADVNCSDVLPFVCYKKESGDMSIMPCGTTDKAYEFFAQTKSCYKFHNSLLTWPRAFEVCSAEGGYLAIINSDDEAAILKDLYAKKHSSGSAMTLLGFRNWYQDGVYRTIHGQTLKDAGYALWQGNQPDNGFTDVQPCGAMYSNGRLDDFWCNRQANFVCEKDPESLMN